MGRKALPPKGIIAVTLREAVDDCTAAAVAEDMAASTVAAKRSVLRAAMELLGENREVWTLTPRDLADVVTLINKGLSPEENAKRASQGLRPRTGRKSQPARSLTRATIRQFTEHCQKNAWLPAHVALEEPTFRGRKKHVKKPAPKARFSEDQWPDLLDAAGEVHPRCRMAVALGLYTGRRASEIAEARWGDIDWAADRFRVYNVKNGRWFTLPLFPELVNELERWRAWVTKASGVPQPDWYLVPARCTPDEIRGPNSRMLLKRDSRLYPVNMLAPSSVESIRKDTRRVLVQFGFGANQGTGTHTWRRSAATVIARHFGLPAAQAFLDHKNPAITQHYTMNEEGVQDLSAALRSGLFGGKAPQSGNVISLEEEKKKRSA